MGPWAPWAFGVPLTPLWPCPMTCPMYALRSSEGLLSVTRRGNECEGAGFPCLPLPSSAQGVGVYFPSLPHIDRNIDLVSFNILLNRLKWKNWTNISDCTLSTLLLVGLLTRAVKTNRSNEEVRVLLLVVWLAGYASVSHSLQTSPQPDSVLLEVRAFFSSLLEYRKCHGYEWAPALNVWPITT